MSPLLTMTVCLLVGSVLSNTAHSMEEEEQFPSKLSQWDLFELRNGELIPRDATVYDLNSALFSDYALKLRTLRLPKGTAIRAVDGDLVFPVGTILSKTFYYPRSDAKAGRGRSAVQKTQEPQQVESLQLDRVQLLETRILINTTDGWQALPYVWSSDQSDATLEVAGEVFPLTLVDGRERVDFEYLVPDANQCSACHGVDGLQIKPIGMNVRHLSKTRTYAGREQNQLAHWQHRGLLQGTLAPTPPLAVAWNDPTQPLEARARAYLDVNCSHCHSASGGANNSGLLLERDIHDPVQLGICKSPVATGRGSGGDSYTIVPGSPRESIMIYRMQSTESDIAMPELGRSLVHEEGVELISEWIRSMEGGCEKER